MVHRGIKSPKISRSNFPEAGSVGKIYMIISQCHMVIYWLLGLQAGVFRVETFFPALWPVTLSAISSAAG